MFFFQDDSCLEDFLDGFREDLYCYFENNKRKSLVDPI